MSFAEKQKYERLDGRDPDLCYYCQREKAIMDDTTPSHKVDESIRSTFSGPWTIVKVGQRCWNRIHNANIVAKGTGFGVPEGLMSMEDKRLVTTGRGFRITEPAFVMDKYRVGRFKHNQVDIDEDGSWFYEQKRYYPEEVELLQPVMGLIMLKAAPELIRRTFHDIMTCHLDDLSNDRLPLYTKLLGIELEAPNAVCDEEEPDGPTPLQRWLAQQEEPQAGQHHVVDDSERGDGSG